VSAAIDVGRQLAEHYRRRSIRAEIPKETYRDRKSVRSAQLSYGGGLLRELECRYKMRGNSGRKLSLFAAAVASKEISPC